MSDDKPIRCTGPWRNNAEMIADVAKVHYREGESIYDCTYGLGKFWTEWRPPGGYFFTSDLDPAKSPSGSAVDFRDLPHPDRHFDIVVLDPDYGYRGTPSAAFDERYGTDEYLSPADRDEKMRRGLTEACRVARRQVWFKCQDQVVSGALRLQTYPSWRHAVRLGFRLADEARLASYRGQPAGRSQKHLRRDHSTLMIFERDERR